MGFSIWLCGYLDVSLVREMTAPDRAARSEAIRRECESCGGGDDPRINRYHEMDCQVGILLDEIARLKRKRRRRRNQRIGRTR